MRIPAFLQPKTPPAPAAEDAAPDILLTAERALHNGLSVVEGDDWDFKRALIETEAAMAAVQYLRLQLEGNQATQQALAVAISQLDSLTVDSRPDALVSQS